MPGNKRGKKLRFYLKKILQRASISKYKILRMDLLFLKRGSKA